MAVGEPAVKIFQGATHHPQIIPTSAPRQLWASVWLRPMLMGKKSRLIIFSWDFRWYIYIKKDHAYICIYIYKGLGGRWWKIILLFSPGKNPLVPKKAKLHNELSIIRSITNSIISQASFQGFRLESATNESCFFFGHNLSVWATYSSDPQLHTSGWLKIAWT